MTEHSLQGLEVVVTRPVGQSDRLLSMLREAGAHATSIPLIAILPLTGSAHKQNISACMDQLQQYQHAIFISQNAAQQALATLCAHDLTWPPRLQAYAVGRTTAGWLAQNGITAITPERMDSEGLLALPALQQVNGQRAIIFRGLGGRETLALGLRGRGMQVNYCELYQRCLPADAPQQWLQWRHQLTQGKVGSTGPVVVCLNSVETLDNLLAIDEHCTRMKTVHWLVPGSRVANAAIARGFKQVVEASDALDETLLKTLVTIKTDLHNGRLATKS